MGKPSETPGFKKLFEEWNKKLIEDGHKEIEDFKQREPMLKDWHNANSKHWRFVTPDMYKDRQEHFQRATDMLNTYQFKNELHRTVWSMYCEGISVPKIAPKVRRSTKTVYEIIWAIRKDML